MDDTKSVAVVHHLYHRLEMRRRHVLHSNNRTVLQSCCSATREHKARIDSCMRTSLKVPRSTMASKSSPPLQSSSTK